MTTIFAYIITILLSRTGIVDFLSFPITAIVGIISRFQIIGAIAGFFVTYLLIDFLWIRFDGNNMPLSLPILFILWDFSFDLKRRLTKEGEKQNIGDQIALSMIVIKLLFFSGSIRWF
jgi:hypothetical protein